MEETTKICRASVNNRKLNCEALLNMEKKAKFPEKLGDALCSSNESQKVHDGDRDDMAQTIWCAAEETIGFRTKKYKDWFDVNQAIVF